MWEVYWSKSQFKARSDENFNMTAKALNSLWHADNSTSIDLSTNIMYCDRLRIRQPGDTSFALKEHMDGGSVERKLSLSLNLFQFVYTRQKVWMIL